MSVHKKLMEARIALQGKKLNKSGNNKFAGYKYFELGDFLPVVQEIFLEKGLCGVVSFLPDVAVLTITDMEDGTFLYINSPMSSAALKGCHDVQNLGAVQTYLRRYLWVTAMEIVEHDALDATTGGDTGSYKTPFKPITPKAESKPATLPPAEKVLAGKPGDWQLQVKEDAEGNWAGAVKAATEVLLAIAGSVEDVNNIFKNNRNIYDKLKEDNSVVYAEILALLKANKELLTKE